MFGVGIGMFCDFGGEGGVGRGEDLVWIISILFLANPIYLGTKSEKIEQEGQIRMEVHC